MKTRPWGKRLVLGLVVAGLGLARHAQADASSDSIWPRIAEGMQLNGNSRSDVNAAAHYYAKHQRQLISTFNRSEPYLWHIVHAVEQQGMPMEVALLPAIESGFNADASSNRLASGLWQLMPGTARVLGLKDSADYNARRDPIASTEAALRYLNRLHGVYGDWLLALAAYNAGELRVNHEIEVSGSRNFWSLKLPKETRTQVTHLLGLAQVIHKPARYGVSLPDIPDKPITEIVVLDQPRDLALASAEVGVPHASMASYNPGLRSLSNSGGQRALLLLPSDASKLRAELDRNDYLPSKNSAPVSTHKAVVNRKHRIKSGDNLWTIARRNGITVLQLKTWNHLSDNAVLKPGRLLIVTSHQ